MKFPELLYNILGIDLTIRLAFSRKVQWIIFQVTALTFDEELQEGEQNFCRPGKVWTPSFERRQFRGRVEHDHPPYRFGDDHPRGSGDDPVSLDVEWQPEMLDVRLLLSSKYLVVFLICPLTHFLVHFEERDAACAYCDN